MYFETCLPVFRGYGAVLLFKYKCFFVFPGMKEGASSSKCKKSIFQK